MPITKGHGNPDWTREETVLALDLLYKHDKPIDRKHADVLELSKLLRDAPIHPVEKRKDSFRNPDGVALKLQNLFSAVEPGRGLTYSQTDQKVVLEFPKTEAKKLARLARVIRNSFQGDLKPRGDDEEEFIEGGWLTSRHRKREGRLRKKLLQRHKDGGLRCEICDFEPPDLEHEIQESFFEAHHRIPLSEAEEQRSTKVSDLSLLCACCHRFIHKIIATRKEWVSPSKAREILAESKR